MISNLLTILFNSLKFQMEMLPLVLSSIRKTVSVFSYSQLYSFPSIKLREYISIIMDFFLSFNLILVTGLGMDHQPLHKCSLSWSH